MKQNKSFAAKYYSRFNAREAFINEAPATNLGIIVCIPVFNEPEIQTCIRSLTRAQAPCGKVELIFLLNQAENAPAEIERQNQLTFEQINNIKQSNSTNHLDIHAHFFRFGRKHAGVGLARKTAMDEALRRFDRLNRPEGIIAGFDADSRVSPNYFVELEKHFSRKKQTDCCSVQFEHPTKGKEFSPEIYNNIIEYELHLRYFKHALQYTGFPYGYYTIGSSFAVRADAYARQGGMNRKKAGEDFYFLQKMIAAGKFSELKTTCVYPSPRISERVPFGTGAAVGKMTKSGQNRYFTYHFEAFELLKNFYDKIPQLYAGKSIESIPSKLRKFLSETDFHTNLEKIRTNSKNQRNFEKHFFRIFNAFKIIRFLNESHRNGDFAKLQVSDAAEALFSKLHYRHPKPKTSLNYLLFLRKIDKSQP